MYHFLSDFVLYILDVLCDLEQYHPRKCYFVLGVLTALIIKYG
jgi:hypothetical protein